MKLAVKNPVLTANETRAAINVPRVAALMRGKGIDRAFRQIASRNLILRTAEKIELIKISPMNKGADIVGKGLIDRYWWDVTTKGAWEAHVIKYGSGGTGLFY